MKPLESKVLSVVVNFDQYCVSDKDAEASWSLPFGREHSLGEEAYFA